MAWSRRRLLLSVTPVIATGVVLGGWVARARDLPAVPRGGVAIPAGGTSTSTRTLVAGGRSRQYLLLTPDHPASPSLPILVVLHGRHVFPRQELQRDGFLPLVSRGAADLVYPAGIGRSWDAGGCCGQAAQQHVDDVGFVRALVAQVDPQDRHPVYLVGFSNGGRLADAVACADPGVVDGFAVVDAVPVQACATPHPITVIQVDGTADNLVPYRPGDHGIERPPVTTEVARLRALDRCPQPPATLHAGALTLSTWSGCQDGTRLAFATYQGAPHVWPQGDSRTPGAGQLIWSFLGGDARLRQIGDGGAVSSS